MTYLVTISYAAPFSQFAQSHRLSLFIFNLCLGVVAIAWLVFGVRSDIQEGNILRSVLGVLFCVFLFVLAFVVAHASYG